MLICFYYLHLSSTTVRVLVLLKIVLHRESSQGQDTLAPEGHWAPSTAGPTPSTSQSSALQSTNINKAINNITSKDCIACHGKAAELERQQLVGRLGQAGNHNRQFLIGFTCEVLHHFKQCKSSFTRFLETGAVWSRPSWEKLHPHSQWIAGAWGHDPSSIAFQEICSRPIRPHPSPLQSYSCCTILAASSCIFHILLRWFAYSALS